MRVTGNELSLPRNVGLVVVVVVVVVVVSSKLELNLGRTGKEKEVVGSVSMSWSCCLFEV